MRRGSTGGELIIAPAYAARSLRERIHIDPTGWRRADDVPASLATLQDAVYRQRRVRLIYGARMAH